MLKFNKEISKNAINKLLEYINLYKENAICFGDSVNDLDMFKSCGISVAMGNAIDRVKAAADKIAPSNEEDGVAKIIETLL